MPDTINAPPVLSTPDTHIFEHDSVPEPLPNRQRLSDEQLETRYEIARTIQEIKQHRWRRIALQFPDEMLRDSARVYQSLTRGLKANKLPVPNAASTAAPNTTSLHEQEPGRIDEDVSRLSVNDTLVQVKLTILADTSYGSCCVDEIAAEHVDADAVIHYGRACLSPTARIPVLHIFTVMDLDYSQVVATFKAAFLDYDTKVVLTADVPFATHVDDICLNLKSIGYRSIFAASILHDPSSYIPNRSVPQSVAEDPSSLGEWHLFHISDPPTSLLLSLTSRMASVQMFSTSSEPDPNTSKALQTSTYTLLRRRYALITSLSTVPVWGILINTLSVKNYLHMVDHVKSQLAQAGKKSYLFVVGKINAAKVANFSEIGGWIVIGCWESSLIDSKEFYKPIITPFELELALSSDDERVWTGEWRSDFEGVLLAAAKRGKSAQSKREAKKLVDDTEDGSVDSEEESEPPEFDLRTGRYISKTRPMRSNRTPPSTALTDGSQSSTALTRRANGDIIAVKGIASPAAEFLAQNRTWKGLGSDFEVRYEDEQEGGTIEEGRTGVARGYAVGEASNT